MRLARSFFHFCSTLFGDNSRAAKIFNFIAEMLLNIILAIVCFGYLVYAFSMVMPTMHASLISLIFLISALPFELLDVGTRNKSNDNHVRFFADYPVLFRSLGLVSSVFGGIQYFIRNYKVVFNFTETTVGQQWLGALFYGAPDPVFVSLIGGGVAFLSHFIVAYGNWDKIVGFEKELSIKVNGPFDKEKFEKSYPDMRVFTTEHKVVSRTVSKFELPSYVSDESISLRLKCVFGHITQEADWSQRSYQIESKGAVKVLTIDINDEINQKELLSGYLGDLGEVKLLSSNKEEKVLYTNVLFKGINVPCEQTDVEDFRDSIGQHAVVNELIDPSYESQWQYSTASLIWGLMGSLAIALTFLFLVLDSIMLYTPYFKGAALIPVATANVLIFYHVSESAIEYYIDLIMGDDSIENEERPVELEETKFSAWSYMSCAIRSTLFMIGITLLFNLHQMMSFVLVPVLWLYRDTLFNMVKLYPHGVVHDVFWMLPMGAFLYGLVDVLNTQAILSSLGLLNNYTMIFVAAFGVLSVTSITLIWGANVLGYCDDTGVKINEIFETLYKSSPNTRYYCSYLKETLLCMIDLLSNQTMIDSINNILMASMGINISLLMLNLCTVFFACNKLVILYFQSCDELCSESAKNLGDPLIGCSHPSNLDAALEEVNQTTGLVI